MKNYNHKIIEEDIKNKDVEIISQKELLKKEIYKEEEEIVDELINHRTINNIHCIKTENMPKNSPIKARFYKFKSKIKSYSVDGKKAKNTKLIEWINNNIDNTKKIEEDVEDLVIEIFINRFNTYPEKECPLPSNALQSKKQIDIYSSKLYEFSIYILSLLHKKFYAFFENLSKKIDFKNFPLNEINKIKEILFYTGVDLKRIFNKAFEKTHDFDLSKILMIMFDEYLIKNNQIIEKINKEINNSPFYKEKEKFEKFIKLVQDNIYYFGTDKQTDIYKESTYNNNYDLLCDINKTEKVNNNDSFNNNKINNNNNKELITKDKEDNNNINKENEQINNKNKNNKTCIDNKEKNKNKNKENIKENNNLIQNLNIDDLVNYINDSGNRNKKKKKKKKKSKKQETIVKTKEEEENYVEEDLVFLNYKNAVEEYTKNILIKEKIKPHYSEEFLKKLQLLCNNI